MRRVVTAALAGVACTGCLREPLAVERTRTTVVLIGLVRAGSDALSVVLGRVHADDGHRPLQGAELWLETPAGRALLEEAPAGACGLTDGFAFTCLQAAYPAPPEPGDAVRVAGVLPSGDRVEGSTVVPGPAPLSLGTGGPLPDTARLDGHGSLPLVLPPGYGRRISAAWPPLGRVWAGDVVRTCRFQGPGPLIRGYPRASSVALAWRGWPSCDPPLDTPWDSAHVDVEILAFDDNFTGYLDAAAGTTPAYLTEGHWGVDGVVGAFGAVTATRVVVATAPRGR